MSANSRVERRRALREAQKVADKKFAAAAAAQHAQSDMHANAPTIGADANAQVVLANQVTIRGGVVHGLEGDAAFFLFKANGKEVANIALPNVKPDDLVQLRDVLVTGIDNLAAFLRTKAGEDETVDENDGAPLADVVPIEPAPVHCGQCNVRIYGEVAERGMCFNCQPEPKDDP